MQEEHRHPHNSSSQQVAHGTVEHHDDHEKKSVLKKVKAKAKKIKDTITKHGHHDDHGHGHGHGHDQYHYENQHIPDDHDLDEEDDVDEDPEIHGAPIYDSAGVRNVTPQGKVRNSGQGVNFGGTMGEEHPHEPRVVVIKPATEQTITTFVREEITMLQPKVNLEEDPHAPRSRFDAYSPANYQTKVTDPTGAGAAEMDITPIAKSIDRMTVHNEPIPNQQPHTLPTIAETQNPSLGIHNQFSPELSTETKTPYPSSTITHDQNLPHLSSEIKAQYPKNHDQFTPVFSTSTQTQHPSHNQNLPHQHQQNLPHISNVTQTQYPTSATSHEHFTPHLLPNEPKHQHSSGIRHDTNLPPYSGATESRYPSAGSHDQFKPELLPTATNLPQHSSAIPSATSNDNFTSQLLPTETRPQQPLNTHHDQYLSPYSSVTEAEPRHQSATSLPYRSSAMQTQFSSSESHDQFRAGLPTEHHSVTSHGQNMGPQYSSGMKTQYPSSGSHEESMPEFSTNYNRNISAGEQPHLHHESMENSSNQSNNSYTDKINSATSAIADTAAGAKNAVASKLGYGEKGDTTSGEAPSNQSSYTDKIYSAASAVTDKAVGATNAVASKIGFGNEKGETTTGDNRPSSQTGYPSVTAAVIDKAALAKNAVASKLGYGEEGQTTTGETPTNKSSYTDKIYNATSAVTDKAADAKNAVASKLGYGEKSETPTGERPSSQSSYPSVTAAVIDKATLAKNVVASKLGYGEEGEKTTSGNPSNQSSYTSAVADKAAAAKNMVASKLGYGETSETTNENASNQRSYTDKISSATSAIADKAASAKNTVASKLGFGEKGETETETETEKATSYEENNNRNRSASSGVSPAEYGKNIAVSLTEKLSPVSENVTGAGSERVTKSVEQDKGVSMKDYIAEKLKPGEDDRALSEAISEKLYRKNVDEAVEDVYNGGEGKDVRKVVSDAVHKRGDEGREVHRPRGKVTESEEVKRRLGGWDDEIKEGEFGKGMVDMVKDTVGSWFGTRKNESNESTQGSGGVSRNTGGERRLQESTH